MKIASIILFSLVGLMLIYFGYCMYKQGEAREDVPVQGKVIKKRTANRGDHGKYPRYSTQQLEALVKGGI